MLVQFFWLLTILCCGYAAVFGGRDARWASALFLAAALLSIPAMHMDTSWHHTQVPVMVIDTIHVMAMYVLTLRARTYWPIWMTGFLLITILTHIATMIAPTHIPRLYEAMATVWVVPALLSMLIGVTLDRRAGLTGPRQQWNEGELSRS